MSQQSPFPDTIFALSSGTLPSGVAVVRLSGPQVQDVVARLAGELPPPRQATLRTIRNDSGGVLDHGLVLFFPGPASFTGEDCAELHVHGGRATVAAVLAQLGRFSRLRQAEAGEFTRRAFINGKIDLTGAEALSDLVAAETEMQRRLAVENASGRQRRLYAGWRERLLHARAMIEAELDFADEADVPGSVSDRVWADMEVLSQEIVNHIEGFRAAEIIREGFRVVLVGPPNAGKSSLLNALARRDVAIVTDVPGTTRDLIEVALDVDGIKIVVTDTAGIRETEDVVERIGVDRALNAANRADLVIELIDPTGPEGPVHHSPEHKDLLRIGTKSDLGIEQRFPVDLAVSARTGRGLPELLGMITEQAKNSLSPAGSAIPSRARHVALLQEGRSHICRAVEGKLLPLELRAEELRLAGNALGRIIGAVDVEDLLGAIFSQFCIGK